MRRWFQVLLGITLVAAAVTAAWAWASVQPEAQLRDAQAALRAGNVEMALKLARRLENGGHTDTAALVRGEALLRSGNYARALRAFNTIRDQGQLRLDALGLAGQCLLQLGELDEAERAFAFVLQQRPDDLQAHRGLAAVYYELAAFPRVVHHAEKWGALAPADGRPWRWLGLIHKELSRYPEATAAYRAALARDLVPEARDEARLELAECLLKQGEYQAALRTLEQPLAAPVVTALTLEAEAEHGLGNTRRVAELVEQALRVNPTDPAALRWRGQMLLDVGNLTEAIRVLETAVQSAPHAFEVHHLLALGYARAGREQEAAKHQQEVKRIQDTLDELSQLAREIMSRPREPQLHARMASLFRQLDMTRLAERSRRTGALLESSANRTATRQSVGHPQ